MRNKLLLLLASLLCSGLSFAQKTSAERVISYGDKGFELRSADSLFLLQIQSRLQFRYATPGDQDPLTFDDFKEGRRQIFKINRARLKVGGHAFTPWLKYYWEYELSQSTFLLHRPF